MKLPQLSNKFKWNYTALAFALPMTMFLVLMFVASIAPFGGQTFLYSDNFHQYYPFFRQFRQALRSGDGVLWSWAVGLGMDYLGLISYYLASPLNLISVLIPESWTLSYFTLMMPIKLSLASLFFAIMLKKLYGTDDLSLPLFGSFYGLCAWALGYQWNIMWLDGFALLPLVVLGTILLLRDKKYILYTLTLFLAVFSNYYVGFFVCLFVFLLFCCYQICRWQGFLRFGKDLFRIGVFTILAIGMTAILELPTLAALQTTYSSVNQFPKDFSLNIVPYEAQAAAKAAWEAFKTAKEAGDPTGKLLLEALKVSVKPIMMGSAQIAGRVGGGLTPTFIDGLPNLFCGVFAIGLGFLFFTARQIKLRDKLCAAFLLVFFVLSFLVRQLDYIWHGMHFTNQIPYRFSFLFSFVLLYMAFRAWLCRREYKLWQFIVAGALSVALLFVSKENWNNPLYWVYNLSFVGLYGLTVLYSSPIWEKMPPQEVPAEAEISTEVAAEETAPVIAKKKLSLPALPIRRQQAAILMSLCIAAELILQLAMFVSGFSIYDYDYPKKENDSAAMFAYLHQLDGSPFYRTEVTHAQTLNDGALIGYNGVSAFTSSANVATTRFMQQLGAGAYDSWNRYCYEESSPVSNLLLNLKYMVERDRPTDGNAFFDVKHVQGDLTLLENNAYLPLGFLAESKLADLNFNNGSGFSFQNNLFKHLTGLSGSVWRTLSSKELTVEAEGGVTPNSKPTSGYCSFSVGNESGKLIYTYQISEGGYMCLDMNLYRQRDVSVYLNDELLYSENLALEQILAVGDVKEGDIVKLDIPCKANQSDTSILVTAAILKESLFRQGYEVLSASTLNVTSFSTTLISGTIDCNRDGLLYTSIPQNGNWKAYVDGEEAEITLLGDCMVCVPLAEGKHELTFRYENAALRTGSAVTAACVLCFLGIIAVDMLLKKRKQKNLPQ